MIPHPSASLLLFVALPLALLLALPPRAASPQAARFRDLGIVAPVSNHRGTVATVDGRGRKIVLSWLMDHRGGYELLLIDAETGRAEEFPVPFPVGDAPYAAILSRRNRYYTHFNRHFVEFDPAQRRYTFCQQTTPQMAMSMTEDDRGVIWSATYPQTGIVSYNPETGEFRDYGHVYRQNWAQYPRSIAVDDTGWVYVGIGTTRSQIVAFDPRTGQATPILPEEERRPGTATVYRDRDGRVYGLPAGAGEEGWYAFHNGEARRIGRHERRQPVPAIAGSQSLFHTQFPDGHRLRSLDLLERTLVIEAPDGTTRTLRFEYQSEGAHLMNVVALPDGRLAGGTFFPFRTFLYDPRTDAIVHHPSPGQWNTIARQGDRMFAGAYGGGILLEWDPARPWDYPTEGKTARNPRQLAENAPDINRPHDLLAYPDGKTILLAGTPGYGYTGGGLYLWDRETQQGALLRHDQILTHHSTFSLAPLPRQCVLGGTTTSPGTGGERKVNQAELYLLDLATRRVEWHAPVLPGVQEYTDLHTRSDGLVYGIADRRRFFVFDPERRQIVHERATEPEFGLTAYAQGPRLFVPDDRGNVFLLFERCIARIDPASFALVRVADSPVAIRAGGEVVGGVLYFGSGSHLYACTLPEAR